MNLPSSFRRLLVAAACGVVLGPAGSARAGDAPIPPLPVGSQVNFVDGGVIAGRLVSCDDATVVVENLDLGLVRLPRKVVAGWKAGLASDRDREQRPVALEQFARDSSPPASAALLLDNDDVATTNTLAIDGAAARIAVEGVAEPVTIPMERIRAIDFVHERATARDRARPAVTLVALRDGSRLAVEPSEQPIGDGGEGGSKGPLHLVLAAPQAAGLAVACPRDAVVATADRGPSVRSLEHEEIAGYGGRDPGDLPINFYVPSRSLSGGPVRARGENAFGGFSMQAAGSVIFVLRPPADRFEGRVAIDDSAGQGGTIRVRLWAETDGGKRTNIFESSPIHGGESPLSITADAPGMDRLEIEVASEGDDWKLARVIWLDPILKKVPATKIGQSR